MRAVFFGTPEIAVPALQALTEIAQVVGVVCQPDRRSGRGLALHAPPVKECALLAGLQVVQPTKVRTAEFAQWLRDLRADVALVMAYGRILPGEVLGAPRRGCMNLHASILPKYRGASPIVWAIRQGEPETGVSLMQMDAGMDTGPVYCCHRLPIGPEETAGELSVRLAQLGAEVVRSELRRAVDGEMSAVAQDHQAASYASLLKKEDGRIDWSQDAQAVHNHVRAMHPWPGAFSSVRGKMVKVLRTRVHACSEHAASPGRVIMADGTGLWVACGRGIVELLQVQFEGRKALTAREVISGRGVTIDDQFG